MAPTPPPGLGARPVAAASTATPATGVETASPATTTGTGEPSPRRIGLVVGIAAVVSAAVAAVAVVILMSRGSGKSADEQGPVARQDIDETELASPPEPSAPTAPTDHENTVEQTTDETPGPAVPANETDAAEKPGDTKPTDEKTDGHEVSADTPPAKPEEEKEDRPRKHDEPASGPAKDLAPAEAQRLKAELEKAAAAQLEGDPDRAIRIARRSLGIAQTPHAYAIMARAYCDKQDLGLAKSVLPRIRLRRLKRKVITYCKGKQVDLGP
jgi:hypothetical protein